MSTVKVSYSNSMLQMGQGFMSSLNNVMSTPFTLPISTTTEIHPPLAFSQNESWSQKGVQVRITFIHSVDHLQTELSNFIGITPRQAEKDSPFLNLFNFQVSDGAVHLLTTISVKRATRKLDQAPIIRAKVLPPAISSQEFFDLYGDAYISEIEAGGMLVGLIQVFPNAGETVKDVQDIAQTVINPNYVDPDTTEGDAESATTAASVDTATVEPDTRSAQEIFEQTVITMTATRASSVVSSYVGGKAKQSMMEATQFVKFAVEFPLCLHVERDEALTPEAQVDEMLVEGVIAPTYAKVTSYNELPQFLEAPLPFSRTSTSAMGDLQELYATVREHKAKVTYMLNEKQNLKRLDKDDFSQLNDVRNELRARELVLVQYIYEFSRVDGDGRDEILRKVDQLSDPAAIVEKARQIVGQAS